MKHGDRIKKILAVLMGIIIVFNIFTIVINGLDIRHDVKWLPLSFLSVESGSMEPEIKVGDLLVDWETPYGQLAVGDDVTFHEGTELVTHRIIRKDGSRYVTKGLANDKADESIGPEEYCAKVILRVPYMGKVLDYFTNPVSLICAIIIVLILFYGKAFIEWMQSVIEKKPAKMNHGSFNKKLSIALVISLMCVTPFMTAAKYLADINEYTHVSAAAQYFGSNYLTPAGDSYYMQGWTGQEYGINLLMRNSDNDLVFNKEGVDVKFGLCTEKIASGSEYRTDYTITLTPLASNSDAPAGTVIDYPAEWAGATKYGPYCIVGNNDAGQSMPFNVKVVTDGGYQPHDKIKFRIMSCTSSREGFYQTLQASFTLEVAQSQSFIESVSKNSQIGNSLVTYTINTTLVSGSNTRDVKVQWDRNKMYLNEYESNAYSVISTKPENYQRDDGQGHGYLILPMQAYSSVSLQLFKYDAYLNTPVEELEITAEEISS